MHNGFSIGRIFGIDITIDWSWSLIFLLLVWYLGGAVFAQAGLGRAQGLPVGNITRFLFGGVATIQREPASPRGEVLLALVGPLTSLVLGALVLWWGRVSTGLLGTGAAASGVLLALSPLSVAVVLIGVI